MATEQRSLKYVLYDYSAYTKSKIKLKGERIYFENVIDDQINYVSIISDGTSQINQLPFVERLEIYTPNNVDLENLRIIGNKVMVHYTGVSSYISIQVGITGSLEFVYLYPDETAFLTFVDNAWLIETIHTDNYIGRPHMFQEGDRPNSWVLNGGTASTFSDVAFTAYAPVGSKALLLNCLVYLIGDGVADGAFAQFRQKGSTETNPQRTQYSLIRHSNLASSLIAGISRTLIVLCDVQRVIQYKVTTDTTAVGQVYLNIDGYFMP